MSLKETRKATILGRVLEGDITVKQAAAAMGMSERQVFRLKSKMKESGLCALSHGNRGRKPVNAFGEEMAKMVLEKAMGDYRKSSLSHISDLLKENEGLKISAKSIGRMLKSAGVHNPQERKAKKKHKSRARRERAGELVQIDASPFDWLETGESYSLHGAIDDATSEILALRMEKTECSEGYLHVLEDMLKTRGVPETIYSDRHTIFFSPKKTSERIDCDAAEDGKTNLTRYGETLRLLGIEHIPARTPQAKGRIERLWGTLQHRLVVEMRVAGVKTLEEANEFLPTYIERHNSKFAAAPADVEPAFMPCPEPERLNLMLGFRDGRKATAGSEVPCSGGKYQLTDGRGKTVLLRRGESITVICARDGTLHGIREEVDANEVYGLVPSPLKERAKEGSKKREKADREPVRPSADHPWRTSRKEKPFKQQHYDDLDCMEYDDVPLVIGGVRVS